MDEHELAQRARTRFQEISRHLEARLRELHEQKAITELDYQKMHSDGVQSGKAVLNAIKNTEYPPEMQQELVANLIAQFEESTAKILQTAELRLLEPATLEEKMAMIDASIASELGANTQNWLRSNPPEVSRLHQDFHEKARIDRQRRQENIVENVHRSYELASRKLFNQLTPKIADRVSRSDEREIHLTQRDIDDVIQKRVEQSSTKSFFGSFFGKSLNKIFGRSKR